MQSGPSGDTHLTDSRQDCGTPQHLKPLTTSDTQTKDRSSGGVMTRHFSSRP